MTKIIAHEYLKEFIFHDMALKKKSLESLEIISPSRLLSDEETDTDTVLCLKLSKLLTQKKDQFPAYREMFRFPVFYNEVISFAKQLSLYGIRAHDLPAEDAAADQLREIVRIALSLDLKEKKIAENLPQALEDAKNSDLKVIEGFENNYFQYQFMKKLKEEGVETISLSDVHARSISRKHALSTRMEIEGCAYHIAKCAKPCNVVLCSPASQLPVLRQVFARYEIPFSYTVSSGSPQIGRCFSALVQFSVRKDRNSLMVCFENQAFSEPVNDDILVFLDQVLDDIEAPDRAEEYRKAYSRAESDKYDPEKALKRDPVTIYENLEKRAQDYFAKIQKEIDSLTSAETPKKRLIAAYEIIASSFLLANHEEMAAGRKILSELQDCIDLIDNDEEALFFARMMEGLSVSAHKLVSDFCTVSDLSHPVLPKENTYVLGASGKNYPGFAPFSGVFDESYVSEIKDFPTLDERQNAYLEQLSWIEKSCSDELIYSSATNDYQGRELIGAFELEQYGKSERWQIEFFDERRKLDHVISRETSEQLFLKHDGQQPYISGSISSVETWYKCPYRYFIASGLYVRKKQTPDLSADSVGTWQHAALEKAVYAPDGNPDPLYAEHLSEERIAELISPYFDALRIASPLDAVRISLSEKRMIESLKKAADFLSEYERGNTFEPYDTEVSFYHLPVSEHVRLNGTIDRISKDEKNHMIEIIDYKSSSKTLSEKNVKAGQQLQLLTYLFAALDQYEDVNPAGTYYFSLTSDNISDARLIKAASVNRSTWKLTENDLRLDEAKMRDMMIKNRKLNGWTFTDRTDAIDRDGKYVNGLKKICSCDSVRDCLETLYEYFYEQLMASEETGMPEISAAPVDSACTYCDYKGICRFHGEDSAMKEIYEGSLFEERNKS